MRINSKNKFIFLLTILVSMGLLGITFGADAKQTIGDAPRFLNEAVAPTGIPNKDVAIYVGEVAQWIFGITGLLFFLLMVYAGMMWFFARGEDDKISDARKTIIAAIIGLFIAVSGFAITTFVSSSLGF